MTLTEVGRSPEGVRLENYCLQIGSFPSGEQLASHEEAARVETVADGLRLYNKDRLGCARGILACAVLQMLVLFAGAMCWGLYSILR